MGDLMDNYVGCFGVGFVGVVEFFDNNFMW